MAMITAIKKQLEEVEEQLNMKVGMGVKPDPSGLLPCLISHAD